MVRNVLHKLHSPTSTRRWVWSRYITLSATLTGFRTLGYIGYSFILPRLRLA